MNTYSTLMKSGWSMNDIDRMDIWGFWEIQIWQSTHRKNRPGAPKEMYIDDALPFL